MKRKYIFTIFLALCGIRAFADDIALSPADGTKCYLYNVGTQKYLNVSGGQLVTDASKGYEFTLIKSDTDGELYLTDGTAHVFSTSFNDTFFYSAAGDYDSWKFFKVGDDTYIIGCLDEDAFAYSNVYCSTATDNLEKTELIPSLNAGLWQLTSKVADSEWTLDEAATDYNTKPNNLAASVTITLKRTALKTGVKNTFCVPFDMNRAQIDAAFGEGTSVKRFAKCSDGYLYYAGVNNIEAGKPYIITPTATGSSYVGPTDNVYTITHVDGSSIVDTPIDVTDGGYTFKGVFTTQTLPEDIYAYNGGKLKHYSMDMTMKGFRAYFFASSSDAKPLVGDYDMDESSAINEIVVDDVEQPLYNLGGQKVCSNSNNLEGLTPGIYIVKGKKVVIK